MVNEPNLGHFDCKTPQIPINTLSPFGNIDLVYNLYRVFFLKNAVGQRCPDRLYHVKGRLYTKVSSGQALFQHIQKPLV